MAKHPNKTMITMPEGYNPNHDVEENIRKMHPHSLAAAHGHRRLLRKLIAVPEPVERQASVPSSRLSLKEALTEKGN